MIRLATEQDLDEVVRLGREFLAAHPGVVGTGDQASMEAFAAQLLAHGAILVDERDGQLVGNLGAMAYRDPYCGRGVATELFWWVTPEARGARSSLRWMGAFDDWCRAQQAELQRMVALDARTGAFYERLGYNPIETHFQRPVPKVGR